MDSPFDVVAAALSDIARWETHRIELMHWHAVRGQIEPPPGESFAGWRQRLARIQAGADIMTVLIPHERAVRALDSLLMQRVSARF